MSSVRWAIVGTGTISRTVVPDLMSCAGADIAIVQSRNPAKAAQFAQEFGIPASTDNYDTVLTDGSIDAIYLATPFATHHAMTKQALLSGKHVLVEKPMAMNAAEATDLFQIASSQGVFLMEAMWMKFSPVFRRLHVQIAEGLIGEPRSLRAAFGLPWPEDGGSRWDITRSGSALLDQGIYPVTLAHSVFGVPEEIHARGTVRTDGLDLAEHFSLEFSGGRFAQCASGMTEFTDPSASVSGTKGWIAIPAPFWAPSALNIHAGSWRGLFNPVRAEFAVEGNGYVPMLREVIEAIGQGAIEHPVHRAADTIAVFRTLDMILEQIRPTQQLTAHAWTSRIATGNRDSQTISM